MRFGITLELNNNTIPKDKNRIFISIIKKSFQKYDKSFYEKVYLNNNDAKNFTFSLYMGKCKFLRDEILIPEKKIYLNFSAYENEDAIMFYNSFNENKDNPIFIKGNDITIKKIIIHKEKIINNDEAIFTTMSPIVVREHRGDNKKTWYHSLLTEKGQSMFKENLIYQLTDVFGTEQISEFKNITVDISNSMKTVKVKNYGIEVLANIGEIRVSAKPYILDYLYKAGIGSMKSGGFGMLDII